LTVRALVLSFALAGEAYAQTASGFTLASRTLTADILRDLPNGANLFAVLETLEPEVIVDGFHSGGLNGGASASLGAFLASPRQTRYRVGGIELSSPFDGTPLLFPHLMPWARSDVTTALMSLDGHAPGLAIDLTPQSPSAQWQGVLETSAASGLLITAPDVSRPPPINHLDQWTYGSVAVGGPAFRDRLQLTGGVTWMRSATMSRASERILDKLWSAFAHTVVFPRPDTRLRTFLWLQDLEGQAGTTAMHLQSTYEHGPRDSTLAARWRLFGGYTRRSDDYAPVTSGTLTVDRLVDGPFAQWLPAADRLAQRASIGGRASLPWRGDQHHVTLGGAFEHVDSTETAGFSGAIQEKVDGIPARVWNVLNPTVDSRRRARSLMAYVEDRLAVSPRVTLDAGVAFDWVQGQAEGSSSDVQWRSLLPRVAVHWRLGSRYDLELVTGYRRSANTISLDLLAVGDPAAPTADVYRWDGGDLTTEAPLIARAGPGTRGDDRFSSIDPGLDRPHTNEFLIGIRARPRSSVSLSVSGIARRQSPLVHVVNVGVDPSGYQSFTIPDDNVDLIGPADDQQLTVYNRLPSSFGRDRFLMTNPDMEAATMGAVVIAAEAATDRLWLRVGATASAAVGSGGARGFRIAENDQDVLGELFANPNAQTFARGRLFGDRAYVIKSTTIYRFPGNVTLGAIARYQDGQPFSRMVVVSDLNQGAEAIQAFSNGRSRFAFTGTLDLRVQKGFEFSGRHLDLMLDIYNALNMSKEVEEYVVTGDRFRTTTFVQPAPVVHVGFRMRL
jgi:hypothetical protein